MERDAKAAHSISKRKQTLGTTANFAKDIAAFANALGGVVLVGSVEDKKTGALARYKPMTLQVAEGLRTAYELALTQRCHPQPVVDVVRIEMMPSLGSGHIVAVNVYPTPLAPVGVRWDTDKKGPSFAFPLRTTAQTHFMTPTELPMLMVPEIRRTAILLDSIPPAQRDDIEWIFRHHTQNEHDPVRARLVEVDSTLTTVLISVAAGVIYGNQMTITLPMDRIRSIWRRDSSRWSVEVDGFLSRDPSGCSFAPRG